jgi:fido (protein-threonine AMPylation protein)
MTQPLHAILRRLHASITSGQEGDSSFREVNVASISRHEGAQANVNRTRHQDVPRLIEETEARILRSSVLSPFERAALVYFEILNIHPFRDGNGRVARLIAGRLLGGVARLAFPIDITSISRTALGPGYHVLHAGRAPSSYRLWIAYMRGLYAAEIQSIARLCDALASLHSDDETQLRAVIVDALDAVEDGRSFIEIVAAAQAKARPAVARLLVTIAAPTLGRSSGHKRTAMEGNR